MPETQPKFERGHRVLVAEKHLHGIAGVVVGHSEDGENVVKLTEEGYTGQLVQFGDDSLVSVAAVQKAREKEAKQKQLPTPKHVLTLSNHDRIPWPEEQPVSAGLEEIEL